MNYNIDIRNDLLVYLDSEGLLNEIKSEGMKFAKILPAVLCEGLFLPPFRFILRIDLLRMQEISYNLFKLFIMMPHEAMQLAVEATYHALRELTNLKHVKQSDIQIVANISSFPNISFFSAAFHFDSKGLRAVCGVLVGRTAAHKYTRSKVYYCKSQCSNNRGRRFNPPFTVVCPICCCVMKEDIRSLDTGDEIVGLVICSSAFGNTGRFQSMRIKIRDELCYQESLQIGMEYNLIVTFEDDDFIVWNICRRLARFEILSKMNALYPLPICNSIAELYQKVSEKCPESPYAFVGTISSTLASDLLPVSSFLQLKTGLMLSLASQNSEDPPVPLVAVGYDTSVVQKLMHNAGQIAERFINYSAGYEQLGGDKRHSTREEVWYDAGALILASTGVCNLGDWSALRKDQCKYVCQSIESGKIILNSTDKNKTEADLVPLKSAVWTHLSLNRYNNQDLLQFRTLVNVFGIPFLADENNEMEIEKICQKILQSSMDENEEQDETYIPLADLKEFVSLVNSRNLVLNEMASKLIHDFFVVIRKEMHECLPVGAIKTITSLAEAHARLSLRNEIAYEDVIAVLFLYNESISALFNRPFIVAEKPDFHDFNSLCEFIHCSIENFQQSLKNYLENYLFI